jgi:glycosyltransferase involved in cell wall biosynthesis
MAEPLLSLIVLTKDEEVNLPVLLASLRGLAAAIFVVDSGSTDRTIAIATEAGARVERRAWTTYADQLNWAVEHLPFATPWVMRMDADERMTPELVRELNEKLPILPDEVTGLLVKRQVWFWGRWIRHGGYYPTWLLRVWRRGTARCEARWMDEHMVIDVGRTLRLEHDIVDENHKGLGFWTDKHNRYADREVKDIIASSITETHLDLTDQAGRRRFAKERVYNKLPLFVRPLLYWSYRYFILLGLLDGRAGLVFHFLQGFWYRFLVDAKVHEQRLLRQGKPEALRADTMLLSRPES